ncbi:MAG: DUF1987 domain-containing protein [Spirochaetota bacterium]|nr:DUF1987 domain-containing protein [Spirochaetota bacterium]
MENLEIQATNATPFVIFNSKTNILEIIGESYPEDAALFYNPIFTWLKTYLSQLTQPATLILKLEYINTSSSKAFMILFDLLQESGKQITVNWHYNYENEMILECGEEFKEDLTIPFNIIMDK